jgi:hypothetical protein
MFYGEFKCTDYVSLLSFSTPQPFIPSPHPSLGFIPY